ncbi:HAD superfamily hydrolase (TIGR01484 family) [Halanaerobium saccharolyticum]|uniref:HAD superfamily hydrolase (TIGR01484 family) n=1 Tax=Halanaerobium saccharolyticum TaxID=43595 RepID=A0A4R7YZQ7_9FIRM|nr:HAD-IIB family hydrolase [Halanaerobium saccharolyticum]RAK07458.1 HAD superfamily hydrolase (TIGR01484 family) [Halanaerobium saccharolyticum]TDW03035.1 HAD superfamily hydrolase (TIGR01484 family) [Halanaerobium saccharolyticum]TDX59331.1 HAD superfamily hydrolase (TIGR01484 family) [Halanaerobium saccharolyticum]
MDDFKMLCLDIDGTLLNSEHQISSKTKRMIKEAVKRGILVILVSARMPKGIWFLQDELEIDQAIISYNGALVIEKNSDYLLNLTIAKRDLKDIYSLARHLDVHISLYQDDHWYIENLDHCDFAN